MSRYLVELIIIGDSIEEHVISRRIGIDATRFFKKGQEKGPGSVWQQSVWSLEVLPAGGYEWSSLSDALMNLLTKLIPAKETLGEISSECDVAISCGHFYSNFGGGPTLSPEVLELLAQFGLKVRISNYWNDQDPADHCGSR